jgi:hypothetical protein
VDTRKLGESCIRETQHHLPDTELYKDPGTVQC